MAGGSGFVYGKADISKIDRDDRSCVSPNPCHDLSAFGAGMRGRRSSEGCSRFAFSAQRARARISS